MVRKLIKTGNSQALTLSTDMKRHIGLSGNEVEVQFVEKGILITTLDRQKIIEEGVARTERQFGNALRNLAK